MALAVIGLVMWFTGGKSDFDEITYAEEQIGMELDSQLLNVGEINLHVVFAGPEDGEPVVLIHGFPEFWFMWRHHMVSLAESGYRVAAIDMRGYNRSDKPYGRGAYTMAHYAGDVTALLDSQGWRSANIVGHDVGAVVTWKLVFGYPERVTKAAIFSVGHPMAFMETSEESEVSWYRVFFNLPILPEALALVAGSSMLADSLKETSRPGTFSDEDLEVYKAAWDRERAFSTMLGSYRSGGLDFDSLPNNGQPDMPVMFFYGMDDKFIPADVAERTKDYLGEDNVRVYSDLSHWLLAEEPEMTASEIIAFFSNDS